MLVLCLPLDTKKYQAPSQLGMISNWVPDVPIKIKKEPDGPIIV